MKRSIGILLLGVLLSTALYGFQFKQGFSLSSARNSSDKYNWNFESEFIWKDHFSTSVLVEREDAETLVNYETEIQNNWKYLSIALKKTYIDKELDQTYIEFLARYPLDNTFWDWWLFKITTTGYYELGYRQNWNGARGIPKSEIVFTKSFSKEIKLFLVPANFKYSTTYGSADLKHWSQENIVRLDISLLTYLYFYLKYTMKDKWLRITEGIGVKF